MREMPKSVTFTAAVAVSMMLAGLMSRCTMPIACAAAERRQHLLDHDRLASAGGIRALRPRASAERHAVDELHRQERIALVQGEIVDRRRCSGACSARRPAPRAGSGR